MMGVDGSLGRNHEEQQWSVKLIWLFNIPNKPSVLVKTFGQGNHVDELHDFIHTIYRLKLWLQACLILGLHSTAGDISYFVLMSFSALLLRLPRSRKR